MSKTIRHYIGGPGHDGKQSWRTRIARDDRGTVLRTDKTNRIAAKGSLKSGGGDSPAGASAAGTATATALRCYSRYVCNARG